MTKTVTFIGEYDRTVAVARLDVDGSRRLWTLRYTTKRATCIRCDESLMSGVLMARTPKNKERLCFSCWIDVLGWRHKVDSAAL